MDKAELHIGAQPTYKDEEDYKKQVEIAMVCKAYIEKTKQENCKLTEEIKSLEQKNHKAKTLLSHNIKLMNACFVCYSQNR